MKNWFLLFFFAIPSAFAAVVKIDDAILTDVFVPESIQDQRNEEFLILAEVAVNGKPYQHKLLWHPPITFGASSYFYELAPENGQWSRSLLDFDGRGFNSDRSAEVVLQNGITLFLNRNTPRSLDLDARIDGFLKSLKFVRASTHHKGAMGRRPWDAYRAHLEFHAQYETEIREHSANAASSENFFPNEVSLDGRLGSQIAQYLVGINLEQLPGAPASAGTLRKKAILAIVQNSPVNESSVQLLLLDGPAVSSVKPTLFNFGGILYFTFTYGISKIFIPQESVQKYVQSHQVQFPIESHLLIHNQSMPELEIGYFKNMNSDFDVSPIAVISTRDAFLDLLRQTSPGAKSSAPWATLLGRRMQNSSGNSCQKTLNQGP